MERGMMPGCSLLPVILYSAVHVVCVFVVTGVFAGLSTSTLANNIRKGLATASLSVREYGTCTMHTHMDTGHATADTRDCSG